MFGDERIIYNNVTVRAGREVRHLRVFNSQVHGERNDY